MLKLLTLASILRFSHGDHELGRELAQAAIDFSMERDVAFFPVALEEDALFTAFFFAATVEAAFFVVFFFVVFSSPEAKLSRII